MRCSVLAQNICSVSNAGQCCTVSCSPQMLLPFVAHTITLLTCLHLLSQAAVEKKANIVGVTTLSDKERAQLRAAK